ncbi:MAG: hypothetical protein HYY16_12700 [Planctomycetes bacterium]|nr:hypothetical protein [Planctomycetota bacterium]
MGSQLIDLPEGLVPEARSLALDMGMRGDSTPLHLLAALLLRRNDVLLVILEDARVDVGRMRMELEERIAEGRFEKPSDTKEGLRYLMNQGVLLAQRHEVDRVSGDHLAASLIEHHPNPASRVLMERGVSIDAAKRWVHHELAAEGGKEEPQILMRRIARRVESRCRVRLPVMLLNRLTVLAEQYLGDKVKDRGELLKRLVQTLAAEVMQSQMAPALRKLHQTFSEARRRREETQKVAKTTARRRSLLEELRLRENYLRSLADWLERQPHMAVDDEDIRRTIAAMGDMPVEQIVV